MKERRGETKGENASIRLAGGNHDGGGNLSCCAQKVLMDGASWCILVLKLYFGSISAEMSKELERDVHFSNRDFVKPRE